MNIVHNGLIYRSFNKAAYKSLRKPNRKKNIHWIYKSFGNINLVHNLVRLFNEFMHGIADLLLVTPTKRHKRQSSQCKNMILTLLFVCYMA